jgi:histidinol-phosphate aminotransferase
MFFPPKPAAEVFERLLEKGIIIRRLTSYKLPAALRVSIGSDAENETFIKTMNEILADANAG